MFCNSLTLTENCLLMLEQVLQKYVNYKQQWHNDEASSPGSTMHTNKKT